MVLLRKNILSEIKKSKDEKSVTDFLKRFILSIVELALMDVYGDNYSTRCLQSSIGIKKLLEDFGINSKLIEGACCFSNIKGSNPYMCSWAGFWDKDHHIWLITEFFEIVDFTISKLNQHPSFVHNENVQSIPVLWWSPADLTPPIFKYVPRNLNTIVNVELFGEEMEELNRFLDKVDEIKVEKLKTDNYDFIYQNGILEGPESLNTFILKGNHWACGSLIIQQKNISFPNWIIEKDQELLFQFNEKNKKTN